MIFHNSSCASVMVGDCLASLRTLPDRSVNCCVTSPPYFGLRDYGTGTWTGGSPDCDHVVGELRRGLGLADSAASTRGGGHKAAEVEGVKAKSECPKCGAKRVDMQIGLEETPAAFIARLVDVFSEVRRVMSDEGTLWVNIGDSYGKDKSLIGIPWMLAFALRADGWYLRQEIIWHKPNPMPESVTDRCTKSHEQLFLLTKSPRYYYDVDAVKEPAVKGASGSSFNTGKTAEHQMRRASDAPRVDTDMRNRRSVWTIPTRPYAGAHFAVFPPALVEPCILAGCPVDGVVLDPFGGSGTTAGVALLHGRNALLLELNPEYAALMPDRVKYIIDKHPKPIQLKAAA